AEVEQLYCEMQRPLDAIVIEVGVQQIRTVLVGEGSALGDHRETHGREHLADEDDQAKDGGDPAGIKRHYPVDGGKGNRESVKDEPGTSDRLEPAGIVWSARAVGLLRPLRKQERENVP